MALPSRESLCLNLGFLEKTMPQDLEEPAILITHSLGALYALRHHADYIRGLVAINAAPCFSAFTPPEILQTMKAGLEKNPRAQMRSFYAAAGLPPDHWPQGWNVPRLQEGLNWLAEWDLRPQLKALSCPVLALLGAQDQIAPLSAAQGQWQGFETHIREEAAHALPVTEPKWCADHIQRFIKTL